MFNQIYYLIRSKQDGKYLGAKIEQEKELQVSYLLVFKEDFEALSYLNAHAQEYTVKFTVECVTNNQLKAVINRWSFQGVGIVEDALIPRIRFLG